MSACQAFNTVVPFFCIPQKFGGNGVTPLITRTCNPSSASWHRCATQLYGLLLHLIWTAIVLSFLYTKMRPDLPERMNEARELFSDERFTECATEIISLLSIHELPRYYQIKCRILLACTQDDWHDAEILRKAAEDLWTHYRHMRPSRNDPAMDKAFDELRKMLDDLEEAQVDDRPDDYLESCEWIFAEGELEDATDPADSEDEEAAYLDEAGDKTDLDLEEYKLERAADLFEGDLSETLYTEDVEALYKEVDSEMIGEKGDPEKSHSKTPDADDEEWESQESVTSSHKQPKAKDEGRAELSPSQREDTLAEDKVEED